MTKYLFGQLAQLAMVPISRHLAECIEKPLGGHQTLGEVERGMVLWVRQNSSSLHY